MKILRVETLINKGTFRDSTLYDTVLNNVIEAIKCIEHPVGTGNFILHDMKHANGVTPIKNNFVKQLDLFGWKNERIADKEVKKRKFDSSIKLEDGRYFAVEWETGNISSSHRALNRIFLGMKSGIFSGGFLVLPSKNMYDLLTDRVGNFKELEGFFEVWRLLGHYIDDGVIEIIEIEHDGVSKSIKPIKKGGDGNSKKKKAKKLAVKKVNI
ncbi:hypothetical protein QNH28_03495 [Paenibacillus sp. G2S3]|uniref:hypothetical protein n=1 Tax=Paenibacillus sp. G2S3 TaxID=3047872 RepID=UPI0024C1B5D1|nr:hypothetical protein [Paenibacillus sp. G2S3]WHY20098.1 hypothetical protein QNH28_03495 [Paenibacillus sp. G2S3]